MPEVVLDDLKAHAGVQHVGRDGVTETVAGQVSSESCPVAVAREEGLDLALPERAAPTTEQWCRREVASVDVATEQLGTACEKWLFACDPVLEPTDDDAPALKVDVADPQERHLPHSQTVLVDQGEEEEVSASLYNMKQPPNLVLREVAWQPKRWWWSGGHG